MISRADDDRLPRADAPDGPRATCATCGKDRVGVLLSTATLIPHRSRLTLDTTFAMCKDRNKYAAVVEAWFETEQRV